MDEHDFVAGPNGLCDKCGKQRKDCVTSNEVFITGMQEVSGLQVNKAIIFFEQIPENCKVQQIACTKYNSFILSLSGQVFSWGETTNALGRVLERRDDARVPKLIHDLKSKFIVSISCGESHVLALDFSKQVFSWGFNKFGQLGQGDQSDRNLPAAIDSIRNIIKISASCNFSYAITENGRVYAWGDNKNFQLGQMVDENGNKQNKFLTPKLIENSPWDKTSDIDIAAGTNFNYFYKNQAHKAKLSGISAYEAKVLQLENQELKRKLEFLTKKVAILEEELYKNDPNQNSKFGLTQDTALQEMQSLVKDNESRRAEIERKMRQVDEEILKLTKEIKELDVVVNDLDLKESNYRDEIEAKDNDLIKIQNKKSRNVEKISEIRSKKEMIQEFIKTIENTKATYYTELHFKQDLLDQVSKTKNSIEIEMIECNKKEIVFKQMIATREREVQRNYIKKKHDNLDHEIIQIIKLHGALKETNLESISKQVAGSHLMSFIGLSNSLLDQLLAEIKSFKLEAKKSPLKSLPDLWDIVEDNIELRKKINCYTEGLLYHTATQVSELYSSPEPIISSKQISALDYAKKLFSFTSLALSPTLESKLQIQSTPTIPSNRAQVRHKWRLC